MTENKPTVEHETWIRVRNCSDIIRVIVEDDQSTSYLGTQFKILNILIKQSSYLFTLDKTKHTTIGSFWSHLWKVLQKKTNLNYLLLLYPCHHIQDVNALQTGDQLKLTTTIHYNTLISERKRSMNQQYQTIHPRAKNGVMDASDINGDSNNDDSSMNNFSSGIIAPSYRFLEYIYDTNKDTIL